MPVQFGQLLQVNVRLPEPIPVNDASGEHLVLKPDDRDIQRWILQRLVDKHLAGPGEPFDMETSKDGNTLNIIWGNALEKWNKLLKGPLSQILAPDNTGIDERVESKFHLWAAMGYPPTIPIGKQDFNLDANLAYSAKVDQLREATLGKLITWAKRNKELQKLTLKIGGTLSPKTYAIEDTLNLMK